MQADQTPERYSVMALFEQLSSGTRFPREEWPAHVTLASNFVVVEPVERLVAEISGVETIDHPLVFRFGDVALFGPHRDIPVRVAESAQVDALHRVIADRLLSLRGFVADEPAHWRGGYHAHLTLRPTIGVGKGESWTATHVAIARLVDTEAEIVACVEIKPRTEWRRGGRLPSG